MPRPLGSFTCRRHPLCRIVDNIIVTIAIAIVIVIIILIIIIIVGQGALR